MTEEELETHAISAWKEGKLQLTRKFDGNGSLHPRRLIDVSATFFLIHIIIYLH